MAEITSSTNYVPQVDYTSRDYKSIRNDMVEIIPQFAPTWTNRESSDFGMTLIELFAYMGDLLNYYIDRSANEGFISTASSRDSVAQIAAVLGYTPTLTTAAAVTLTFQNSTSSTITVPALTKVTTSTIANAATNQLFYETASTVIVPAASGVTNGNITVIANEGNTISSETVGSSNGLVSQTFKLSTTSVIENTISIIVNGVTYTKVNYLVDYSGSAPVFISYTDSTGYTYVQFGDNISGRVPPINQIIYATYRVGGGSIGNINSNTIKFIFKMGDNSTVPAGLTVNNQDILVAGDGAATGGADAESVDSIRINAPKSIAVLNRAVSLQDYANLAIQVTGVAKASSVADVYTSVTIYFAPFGDATALYGGGVTSDGVTPSAQFNTLATTLSNYFVDKAPANTTITFQPPTYVNSAIKVAVTVSPQFKQTVVAANVKSALLSLFTFSNVVFGDTITYQDVLSTITSVEGVASAKPSLITRTDAISTYTINNKVLTSYVATLTTSAAHTFNPGDTIIVDGVDTTFNGTWVVTAVTSTTVSYRIVTANVSTVAVTPTGTSVSNVIIGDVICASNEIPQLLDTNLTITPTGGIVA
jgi:hypothetical protein